VKEVGEDGEEKAQDGCHGNTFLCPTCQAPVVIPEGGVAALQVLWDCFDILHIKMKMMEDLVFL
jgi:hypothetical protein